MSYSSLRGSELKKKFSEKNISHEGVKVRVEKDFAQRLQDRGDLFLNLKIYIDNIDWFSETKSIGGYYDGDYYPNLYDDHTEYIQGGWFNIFEVFLQIETKDLIPLDSEYSVIELEAFDIVTMRGKSYEVLSNILEFDLHFPNNSVRGFEIKEGIEYCHSTLKNEDYYKFIMVDEDYYSSTVYDSYPVSIETHLDEFRASVDSSLLEVLDLNQDDLINWMSRDYNEFKVLIAYGVSHGLGSMALVRDLTIKRGPRIG